MLRDKNLIPLSHQHQHALALCVRLDRAVLAGEVDVEAWQAEIQQIFQQEIGIHFAAEEQELFPAAVRFPEMQALVDELLSEHAVLRDLFARAETRTLDAPGLKIFADTLAAHIRKEERQLFEGMQQRMSSQELARLGTALERALADASKACLLPNEATRLRPKTGP
jgi:hemerythrin-like domain-containing protein